jgi:SAM-dependent methyltransferase
MCNRACIKFAEESLSSEEIKGKDVLEVGSLNVNGSIRSIVNSRHPAAYFGVDITPGPGVDEICDIASLVCRFGRARYDIVICTEVLEHVKDWRSAVSNLKRVLKEGGVLLLTTRSKGFEYHGYPCDFWRYEEKDLKAIFSDFRIEALVADPSCPGVFLKAHKEASFVEAQLAGYRLYSVLKKRACRGHGEFEIVFFRTLCLMLLKISALLPSQLKIKLKKILPHRLLA